MPAAALSHALADGGNHLASGVDFISSPLGDIRAVILPHPGKQYGGEARKSALAHLPPDTDCIIYLSARHNLRGFSPDDLKILQEDFLSGPQSQKTDPNANRGASAFADLPASVRAQDRDGLPYREHSFDWVEPELRERFPKAKILAISPQFSSDAPFPAWAIDFKKWVIGKLVGGTEDHDEAALRRTPLERSSPLKKCVLIGTTDLHHYPLPRGGTAAPAFLAQLRGRKQADEERLLKALTSTPTDLPQQDMHNRSNDVPNLIDAGMRSREPLILCGPDAIELFHEIVQDLHYRGKVVDYYDSLSSQAGDRLDKYTTLGGLKNNPNEEDSTLVSYASLVFGPRVRPEKILEFDVLMALGTLKTHIWQSLFARSPVLEKNIETANRLPAWSPFHNTTRGVFMGTGLLGDESAQQNGHDEPTCCEGAVEEENTTKTPPATAHKILQAGRRCPSDAHDRWERPYTVANFPSQRYHADFLESRKNWRSVERITSETIRANFKMDGSMGMALSLPRAAGGGRAFFLPKVAQQFDGSHEAYLEALARKAGGRGSDWMGANAKIFSSVEYTWDPAGQKLHKSGGSPSTVSSAAGAQGLDSGAQGTRDVEFL